MIEKGDGQMDTIIHNRIRCKKCGEIIESHTVHEFKWCSCGAVAVDGGKDYLRRCGNREDYYNNRFFGGTRNEYRLTGMTSFIRQHNLKAGDTVILSRRPDGCLSIKCQRQGRTADGKPRLVVTGTWKVVKY